MTGPTLLELGLIAFAISLDNLAATLVLGTGTPARARPKIAGIFALFGGVAPILGIWVGRGISGSVEAVGTWIGTGALAAIGIWTVVRAIRRPAGDPASGVVGGSLPAIMLLGATLSLDNLVVGFGLGVHGADPITLGVLAAGTVLVSSYIGLVVGRRGVRRWGRRAEIASGLLLLVVAVILATDPLPRGPR
jgi:manganese efflux pump family protein